jgi:hypothetical protein
MSHLDSKNLPENIRRCMDPKIRKAMGALTLCEVFEKEDHRDELQMHRQLLNYLNHYEIPHVHCRTDQKATTANGTPDFIVLWGERGCAVELKGPRGKLTPVQESKIQAWTGKRVPCLVTNDLGKAIDWIRETLRIPTDTSAISSEKFQL